MRAEPVTVRDAFDRSVTVPEPPQRIVTIFASNTEMVAALGLADRIVGIEAYTRYPPEVLNKPLVGGRLGFSVDEVVAQRPDLVVVTPSRQAANQLVDPMQRLGIPIVVLLQRNVPEILSNIRLLGRLTGVPERGEQLAASLQARLDKVDQRVAGRQKPERDHDHRPTGQRPAAGDAAGHLHGRRHRARRRESRLQCRHHRPGLAGGRCSTPIPTCCCSPATKRT